MMNAIIFVLSCMTVSAELQNTGKMQVSQAKPCHFTEIQRGEMYPLLRVAECDLGMFEGCYNMCYTCDSRVGNDLDCKMFCANVQGGKCQENLIKMCESADELVKSNSLTCDGASQLFTGFVSMTLLLIGIRHFA
eukprot:gnl/MRDRNA2_/MRDRNA2_84662_c0_seq1.p1 gnl/MRDRNA2_/MRDRNA2_84662_c0~~gnl/MRDRNA2_/MRDRNA2_84662_c0_seq1.p1  ORF type:complete len:135 (+),score=9.97 gnl/MRDRNA2_/MRDRNA2_84662_c0_seq1:75-479(+)